MANVTEVRKGLEAALEGSDIAEFPDKLLYQFEDAKPYNLNYPIIPAAVTYPKTPEQIVAIVRYAASANLKVQARSGGHSYGNYCMEHALLFWERILTGG
jgi:FAD/FMN-containing dehydrogenase